MAAADRAVILLYRHIRSGGVAISPKRTRAGQHPARTCFLGGSLAAVLCVAGEAAHAQIVPHRAVYTMELAGAKPSAGIVGARGAMIYELGESCAGWALSQTYTLVVSHKNDRVEIVSDSQTWETKDGLRFRFKERQTRNGALAEESEGEANLAGAGQLGYAEFSKPRKNRIRLAENTLFPTAHTALLIEMARQGEAFIERKVFEGTGGENGVRISAHIAGPRDPAGTIAGNSIWSPLLAAIPGSSAWSFILPVLRMDHPTTS